MSQLSASTITEVSPKLDQNILLFVRLLRAIGMKVGPASVIDAVEAAQLIGISDKSNFFHCMSSCLIKAPQDRELFKQAFFLFWQNPKFQERMRDLLIPQFKNQCEKVENTLSQRLQDALGNSDIPNLQPETETIEIDASGTVSDIEFFQHKDFRMMTHAEMDKAIEAIKSLRLY
ncbi:MAG: VWA domain-containing protein, partial [Candidatus Puniceispirillaceae bacterium]